MHRISKLLSRSLFRSAPHACLQLYYSQDYPSLIKKLAALSHTDYLAIRDPSFQHSLLDLAIIQNNSELIAAMASELPYFSKIVNNKDNEEGMPPVLLASRDGNLSILRLLHARGAFLFEQKSDNSLNALHLAAHNNQIRIMHYLLQANVSKAGIPNQDGLTAMSLAFRQNNYDSINLLKEHGIAPFGDLDTQGYNLNLISLVNQDDLDLYRILEEDVKQAQKRDLSKSGNVGILHLCAQLGAVKIARYLLENGAVASQICNLQEKSSPLHFAALYNQIGVGRLLLEHKGDKNAKDRDGNTPLHLSVMMKHEGMVKLLIEFGADVGVENVNGQDVVALGEFEGTRGIRLLLKRAF